VVFDDDLCFVLFFVFAEFQLVFAYENLGGGVVDAKFAGCLADAKLVVEDLMNEVLFFLSKQTITSSAIRRYGRLCELELSCSNE